MNSLIIDKFENAFGIKRLSINTKDSNKLKNAVIYAQNGTFKSSFARTFYCLKNNKEVFDRLSGKNSKIKASIGNKKITTDVLKNNMIIFSNDIMNNINFDNSLVSELNKITHIDYKLNELIKLQQRIRSINLEIKNIISGLQIDYDNFLKTIGLDNNNICHLTKELLSYIDSTELIETDNMIDSKLILTKTYSILDDDTFSKNINNYKNILIKENTNELFSDGFSINKASTFLNSLRTSNFLSESKQRTISIGSTTFYNYKDFEDFINKEMQVIVTSEEAKSFYKSVDSLMGISTRTDDFKQKLKQDINFLDCCSHSRKKIILSLIKRNYKYNIKDNIKELDIIENEINQIANEANKQKCLFDDAIEIFKRRFHPVFDVEIINKKSIYTNKEFPILSFTHKKSPDNKLDYNTINNILSSGEKTALNVIKFIVKYESIKNNNPVIILDDVVETFDYGNRYAFIRYIDSLKHDGANIIVLTNNYDFFRNVYTRNQLTPLVATINKNNSISISSNKNILFKTSTIKNINGNDNLLFALPFIREMKTFNNNNNKSFYDKLFHYNKSSSRYHIKTIINKLNGFIENGKTKLEDANKQNHKYIDVLFNECNKIINKQYDTFEIKPKIILSLGIRIKCEKLMIKNDFTKIADIKSNQTRILYEKLKLYLKPEFCELMEEILVATPEFLHLNAFMYEPLIDIDPKILNNIYKQLLNFENESIFI